MLPSDGSDETSGDVPGIGRASIDKSGTGGANEAAMDAVGVSCGRRREAAAAAVAAGGAEVTERLSRLGV